jgi:hypothetical protein
VVYGDFRVPRYGLSPPEHLIGLALVLTPHKTSFLRLGAVRGHASRYSNLDQLENGLIYFAYALQRIILLQRIHAQLLALSVVYV